MKLIKGPHWQAGLWENVFQTQKILGTVIQTTLHRKHENDIENAKKLVWEDERLHINEYNRYSNHV